MAAFSYQHHPFLLDHQVFLPNTPIKMSGFSEEPNNSFSQFYQPESLHQIPLDFSFHESSCLENGTKLALSNNEASVTNNKNTADSSSVVDKPENGEQVTQKVTSMDKKRKSRDGSPMNSAQSKEAREVKGKKQRKCNGKPKADKKDQKKVPEEAPTGYIHVRARRGQATDSHSLAERVRREKISERMKLLQALVPGCDKVTGKALMLDEIINYVQSLQNQVEFLSMKLASVNPMFYDFGMDLDSFMVTPEVNTQRLNGLVSPLPNVQKCNPDQATAFSDTTTTFTTPNSYPLLVSTSSVQFQQVPQDNGQLLWDVHEQREKLINQSGFSSNLWSFH